MTDPIAAFRFGHGLPLPDGAPTTPEAMLATLAGPDHAATRFPAPGMAEVLPAFQRMRETNAALLKSPDDRTLRKADRRARRASSLLALQGAKAALARATASPDGLRERLAGFWGDHFTVVSRAPVLKPFPTAMMEDAIRPNLTGSFANLLIAVTLHPGMLTYLDQVNSIGPTSRRGSRRKRGLNENLARELLELHTLGVGGSYSQVDVRQMAELLTGLTFVPKEGFAFDAARAEPGPETVLGVTYDGNGTEPVLRALTDLARHPETVRHLSRKLAVHFVSDTPDPGLVAALEARWRDTDGNLLAVTEALLTHPAAWVPSPEKARQPFDFVAASFRALGFSGDRIMEATPEAFTRLALTPMADMGQPFQTAPGPDGWPEEAEAWITPQRLAARISWAMEVPGLLVSPIPEPAAFASRALGSRASERLLWAAARAESLREGVGLVLSSPEFNRR